MYKKFMNGKIMKKVIAVAAAAALACTTAGCSSGKQPRQEIVQRQARAMPRGKEPQEIMVPRLTADS